MWCILNYSNLFNASVIDKHKPEIHNYNFEYNRYFAACNVLRNSKIFMNPLKD